MIQIQFFLNKKNLDNTKYRSALINSKTQEIEKIFNKSLIKIEDSLSYVGIAYINDHKQFKNIVSKSDDPSGKSYIF